MGFLAAVKYAKSSCHLNLVGKKKSYKLTQEGRSIIYKKHFFRGLFNHSAIFSCDEYIFLQMDKCCVFQPVNGCLAGSLLYKKKEKYYVLFKMA